MKVEMKGHLINLTITVIGTVIGTYVVHKLFFNTEPKAPAVTQKSASQPPRKVEQTTLPLEDQITATV